jgi:hypothetical protein
MTAEIHLNDIGTQIRVLVADSDDVTLDISNATDLKVIFKKPSGSVIERTASFYTDGTDGILKYVTVDGDLDEIGSWKIQVEITAPNGTWKTNFKGFRVYRNLS